MVDTRNAFLPEPIYKIKGKSGSIKVATPDILLDDPKLSFELMTDYTFSSIGGTEILSATRTDLVDSPYNDGYTVLRGVGKSFRKPQSIVFNDTSSTTFGSFSIDLNDHLLENQIDSVTSDTTAGTVTISLNNLKRTYRVEIELFSDLEEINGTI